MTLRKLILLIAALALAACGAPSTTAAPTPPPPAIPSPIPTEIPPQPSPTFAPSIPTDTTAPPAATQGTQMVKIFLIAVDDQGVSGKKVGCGDSAVPVQVEIPPTQGVLKAALQALLGIKEQHYGESGLYNALYQSDLQVESAKIENGKATIQLTGTLMLGGECDNPRVAAQLEETALQFSTVTEAAFFLNGKPLEEVLSLK